MSKISVIIPVYNQKEEYFKEAIESVINQTRKPDEIIIIDDGSNPPLGFALSDTKNIPIKFIKNEKNMGIGYSRQRGIDEATGDYIAFLSSDDVWDENLLKIMIETAEKYPEKILYSHYYLINEKGEIINLYNPSGYKDHDDFCVASWEAANKNTMFVNFSTVFIPKKVFEKVKFDKNLRFCEDLDFLLRSMKHFEYFLIKQPLLKYRAVDNLTSKIFDKIPRQNIMIRKKCMGYWKVKYNHVYDKNFWDNAVLFDKAEEVILDGYTKEKFWAEEIKIDRLNKNIIFLDLGCGIGRIAKWIAPKVKEYHGVDFSFEMINKAKEIYKDYENTYFIVNNGEDLIYEDEKFDIVYVSLVFQHMPKENIFSYLNEVYRILKKDGIFLANDIPKSERYINGLTNDELKKAFLKFEVEKDETEYYYNLKCQKKF